MSDVLQGQDEELRPGLYRKLLNRFFNNSKMALLLLSLVLAFWFRTCHMRIAQPSEKVYIADDRPSLFSGDVNIVDVRNGSMKTLQDLAWRYDTVAAMLYAPWSGQSRKVAPWFAEAAVQLKDEVLFVAVDCWYPLGLCRQDLSLPNYPRLLVYFSQNSGFFEYLGGLRSYEIARFLTLVVRPLFFVSTAAAFKLFVASEETVVLGFFDFRLDPEPQEYLDYLGAARLALADDVGDGLRFGVISSMAVALIAEMPEPPSVMLCRSTRPNMMYDGDWTPQAIYKWASKHREKRVGLLVNSLNLVGRIRWQPALILFLPLNDSFITSKLLMMLRRLAGAFYSCSFSQRGHMVNSPTCTGRHDLSPCLWNGNVHLGDSQDDENTNYGRCSLRSYYFSLLGRRNSLLTAVAVNSVLQCFQSFDSNSGQYSCDIDKGSGSDRGASYCSSKKFGCTDFETLKSDNIDTEDLSYANMITGLGCSGSSVRNMSFFYMDSSKHWEYAKGLSVDAKLEPRIAVTIADVQNKSQFVYNENQQISEETTAEFIWKFLRSKLKPRLRSAPVPTSSCIPSHLGGCVWEVVGSTFDQVVLDSTKDVLLLHYSPSCAFCNALVPVILRLAHTMESYHHIRVARINRVDNELPRDAFQPVVYPSFVLYPADRKNEPLLYPRDASLTVRDLLSFLSRHGSTPPAVKIRSHKAASKLWTLRQERNKAVERGRSLQALIDVLKSEKRVLLARAIDRAVTLQRYRRQVDELLSEIDVLVFGCGQPTRSPTSFPSTKTDLDIESRLRVRQLQRRIEALQATNTALFRLMNDQQSHLLLTNDHGTPLRQERDRLREKLKRTTVAYRSVKGRFDLLRARCRHLTIELVWFRSFASDTVARYEALARRVQRAAGLVLHAARAIQGGVHSLTQEERTHSVVDEIEEAIRLWTGGASPSVRRRDSSDLLKPLQANEVERKAND